MSIGLWRMRPSQRGAGDGIDSVIESSSPPLLGPFAVATCFTILCAGFSGLFWLETERIWVFLTPLIAPASAYGLLTSASVNRIKRLDIVVTIAACVAMPATYEALFKPYLT